MNRLLRLLVCLQLAAPLAQAQALKLKSSIISAPSNGVAPAVNLQLPRVENGLQSIPLAQAAITTSGRITAPAVTIQPQAGAAKARQAPPTAPARDPRLERILKQLRKAVLASDPNFSSAVSRLETLFDEKTAKETPDAASNPMVEGLSIKWIRERLKKNRSIDPAVLKLQKKAQWTGFAKIPVDAKILARHNDRYTTELPVGRVTDQKESGRCWIFAGLNMIRSTLIARGKVAKNFEFSENHLYYFSQLERSNRYLEKVVKQAYTQGEAPQTAWALAPLAPNIGDGGNFAGFQFLVEKYGLLPKSAMPETKSSGATSTLDSELNASLADTVKELAIDARRVAKPGAAKNRAQEIREKGISRVMKILSAHLGTPPDRFEYASKAGRKRSYTPRHFARDFVGYKFDDYVQAGSWPHAKRGELYELQDSALGAPGPKKRATNYRHLNVDIDGL